MGSIDSRTIGDFFARAKLKNDVCEDILQRSQDVDIMESCSVDFCRKLCSHFDRLPATYAMNVKFDGIKVVLKHMKLLDLAKTPANCPVIDVCEVKAHPADEEIYRLRQPLYKITCAITNKSGLYSRIIGILGLMNLRIKELSISSTTDGYSLLIFVVTGVPQRLENMDQLCKALRKEFLKADQVVGSRRIDPLQFNENTQLQSINQSEWPQWYMARILCYGGIALLAVYCAGIGIALMHGKRPRFLFAECWDNGFLGILFLLFSLKYFV